MFEEFTDLARSVVTLAMEEARTCNHPSVDTGHLLLGLITDRDGAVVRCLGSMGITAEQVRAQWLREVTERDTHTPRRHLSFASEAQRTIEMSRAQARTLGDAYVGPTHLLLALMEQEEALGTRILTRLGGDPKRIKQEILKCR